jgi:hypothetical protein
MSKFEAKCPNCGKIHHSDRQGDIVVCDCWQYCPLCGAEMTSHIPALTANVYGIDGKRDFDVLMVCTLHSPPFYSTQKPVEVVCT